MMVSISFDCRECIRITQQLLVCNSSLLLNYLLIAFISLTSCLPTDLSEESNELFTLTGVQYTSASEHTGVITFPRSNQGVKE